MKLFGGKRSSHHVAQHRERPHHDAEAKPAEAENQTKAKSGKRRNTGAEHKKHRLTGLQRGLLLLLASLVVLAGVVVGIYKALVKPPDISKPRLDSQVSEDGTIIEREPFRYTDDEGNEVEAQFEAPGSHVEGCYNILLVGTNMELTDTIMIAHLDTVNHKVALMSVPRDTLVYGNYSVPKINSVYSAAGGGEKGIAALEQMLASILGFEVDGYAMVDLQAFVDIINIIGGVTFNVPQRMYYSDPSQNLYIDLQAGEQLLNGEQAMGVVRYRKGYAAADIKRTEVQQDFMVALANQLLSLKTITKIQPIVETCIEHVDTDLTLGNVLYFVQELLNCDLSTMETMTLPGDGTASINGGSYYSLYPNQVLKVVNEYFNPYDADISLSSLHIRTASGYSGGSSSGGSSSSSSSGGSNSSSTSSSSGSGSTGGSETTVPDSQEPVGSDVLDNPNDTTEPGTGTTEPSTGTTEPGTGTTEPGTGTTEPGTGTTEPGTGTTEPGTGTTEPGTGTTEPGAGEPNTGTETPGTGTGETGETGTETSQQPTTDNGGSNGSGILDPVSAEPAPEASTTEPTV